MGAWSRGEGHRAVDTRPDRAHTRGGGRPVSAAKCRGKPHALSVLCLISFPAAAVDNARGGQREPRRAHRTHSPPFAAFGSMTARFSLSAYRSCNDRWLTLLTLCGSWSGTEASPPSSGRGVASPVLNWRRHLFCYAAQDFQLAARRTRQGQSCLCWGIRSGASSRTEAHRR